MIRRSSLTLMLALLGLALPVVGQQAGQHFGAAFTDAKEVALSEAISNTEKYADQTIKIVGEIRDVCQAKGCWLIVTDGEHAMQVKFKDYGFFVPKNSAGKKVVLEGIVEKKTISEDHARHLASEAKEKVDVSKIKGPQQVVMMMASGVQITD